jgi:predicted MFS family arabinose efflux permease
VGTLLAEALSWRSTFVLIAVVAAVAAVITLATMPHLPGAAPVPLGDRLAPLRDPGVLRMVTAIFLCGAGGLMFYTYLGPITAYTLGTDAALPVLLLIVGLVGVVSALLGGRLTDKHGPRLARLAILGGHALALALMAGLVATHAPVWAFGAGVVIWSIFAWALNPPMQASTIAASPETPMIAVSLNISGLYLGAAVAGALGGLTLERLDAAAIPVVGTIVLVVAWIVAAPAVRSSRHDEGPGPIDLSTGSGPSLWR